MRSEPIHVGAEIGAPQVLAAVCDQHGPYQQTVTVILGKAFRSPCPVCQNDQKERLAAEERAKVAWERTRVINQRLGAAAIPKRFADKCFDDYIATTDAQKKALGICLDYAANFDDHAKAGRCLLLVGKPGTGKTHLAASIANDLIHHSGKTAVYRTLGGVLQAIRATYEPGSEQTESKIIGTLVEADLLILDEIGASKEKPSDFELTTLFSIINGRYEQVRPTVIISNLSPKELSAALGERSADRLREGGVVLIPFNWESQRGKEGF